MTEVVIRHEGSSRWSEAQRRRERELLGQLAAAEPGSIRHRRIRDELVTMHMALVEHLARRFRDRGEPHEDLVQVGTIGLIKAVDRFDPERGVEFSTYATPTILGEIRRHFRDRGWAIRVPRRLQELRMVLVRATGELTQTLGHAPTVAHLAAHLQLREEEILEGIESAQAYSTSSLDGPDGAEEGTGIADTMGVEDEELEAALNRAALAPLLARLPERDRRILMLRFFHSMTQSQIAQEIGISQMHVSRLLTRSLATLRIGLEDAESA
jgi:RNA polymerase sigma-B factor